MLNQDQTSKQLFDLLSSRDIIPDTYDKTGRQSIDPENAMMFRFDFTAISGENYGSVVITIEDSSLAIYYSNNLGRGFENKEDKKDWYDFLYQLKQFAVRHFLTFDIRNVNRMKFDVQGLKNVVAEGWMGNRKVSYNGGPDECRLMIRHSQPIQEGERRYRAIESLFLETSDGERFKMPFKSITGGRAMMRHVLEGGRPYDDRGQRICDIVEELGVLRRFNRMYGNQILEDEVAGQLIERSREYCSELNNSLKRMSGTRGYQSYFENWNPLTITEEDLVVETLREWLSSAEVSSTESEMVVENIMQRNNMKEIKLFESWTNRLLEGCWSLPETPEQQEKFLALMSKPLPAGPDGTNATQQLYHLFGEDSLFDSIEDVAEIDPDFDVRSTVVQYLQRYDNNPGVEAVLKQINIDDDSVPDVEPENVDIDISATEPTEEPPVSEDYKYSRELSGILKHAGVADPVDPQDDQWDASVDYEVSDYDDLDEGYRIIPPLDPGYEERPGLEGPINANGRPLYYDPKEGRYWDPRTDLYLDHDEAEQAMKEGLTGQSVGRTLGKAAGTALGGRFGPAGAKLGGKLGAVAGGKLGNMVGDKIGSHLGMESVERDDDEDTEDSAYDYRPYSRKEMDWEKLDREDDMDECGINTFVEADYDSAPNSPQPPVHDPELSRLKTLAGFNLVR